METIIMVISAEIHSSSMQGPSASAYVTYYRPEDALKAIQAVNNIFIDGRTLKGRNLPYCIAFSDQILSHHSMFGLTNWTIWQQNPLQIGFAWDDEVLLTLHEEPVVPKARLHVPP